MITSDETRAALREALDGATHLAGQIDRSTLRLAAVRPLSTARLLEFDDVGWDAIYAFQMKFLLLQDLAAKRIVRGVLALSGEDPRDLSAKAALARLETLGALVSMDDWLEVTAVRNTLAHDYPVNLPLFIDRFEDAWEQAPRLLAMVRGMVEYIETEGLLT